MRDYRKRYSELIESLQSGVIEHYGDSLVSLVFFGSVARGLFRPDSDIDLLIIAEKLPRGRVPRVLDFQQGVEARFEETFRGLRREGIHPLLSPIIKTPEEVRLGSPLFLDMVEDARISYDRGQFFRNSDPQAPMNIATCADYLWATPALSLTRNHIVAVAADIVQRYDVDGLHLDLIRYPGSTYSFDPYTMQAFSDALHISPTLTITDWRSAFQRAQIDAMVQQIYSATTTLKPDLLVSAAVWPNYTSGYNSYYQDSKGWLARGIVDANMPMLYASDIVNDLAAWISTQGFIADSYGRYVLPGISANYADVNQIIARIESARSLGAKGVALFSYGALNSHDYWGDLANGPFAITATVPRPGWKT